MAATTEIICKCGCGRKRSVRNADIKRGWGKYFNKSCKARHQERRTGQYKTYLNRREADADNTSNEFGSMFNDDLVC